MLELEFRIGEEFRAFWSSGFIGAKEIITILIVLRK